MSEDRSTIYHYEIKPEHENNSWSYMMSFIGRKGVRILDVGCACGDAGRALKAYFDATVYGLESNAESVLLARDTHAYEEVVQCDVDRFRCEDYPSFAGYFDYVVCGDVLEHLREPTKAVLELKRCLRPGGKLLASIPNVAHMSVKANLLDDSFPYTSTGLLEVTHIHFFTDKSIAALLADTGFSLVDCKFTFVDKDAWSRCSAYDRLPVYEQAFIFTDWRSYVCQYVVVAEMNGDRPSELLNHNLDRLAITPENAPACISNYRQMLLANLPPTAEALLREDLKGRDRDLDAMCGEMKAMRGELDMVRGELDTARGELDTARGELAAVRDALQSVQNATCWRMTKPIRVALDIFKTSGVIKAARGILKQFVPYGIMRLWLLNHYQIKIDRPLFFYPGLGKRLVRLVKFSLPFGVVMMLRKSYHLQDGQIVSMANGMFRPQVLSDVNQIDGRRRRVEAAFKPMHRLSILVPIYNTPTRLLKELLESVRNQTCGCWELCLGDASDGNHTETSILAKEATKDSRVKYLRIKHNGGISVNTNAILPIATGDVVALMDHDDLLHPSAVYEVLKEFEDADVDFVYTDELTFADEDDRKITVKNFKPDFSPDYLRSTNYICHFSAFRRGLVEKAGGFLRREFDGSQDHDLFLRMTAVSRTIRHVPEILYFWRACAGSTAKNAHAKNYASLAGCRAVAADLERRGWKGVVDAPYAIYPGFYRVRYEIDPAERVSIIIPTRDHAGDLKKCLSSVFNKSTHRNYEVIILDNGSTESELKSYYEHLKSDSRVKILYHDVPFNYSEVNNYAVKNGATGRYLLFLNNDVEVVSPDWIEEMQMYAQRSDVGCVGAKLFYPDGTIQHGGVVLGAGGVAGHAFLNAQKDDPGRSGRLISVMNYSAVTGACMMIRREVFDKVGGFCEDLAVAFNDVDLCMKIRSEGYLVVWTPHAMLYHCESKSRGSEDTPAKKRRFEGEVMKFLSCWKKQIDEGDPYYNIHLRLDGSPFSNEV